MEDFLLSVVCALSEACLEAILDNAGELVVLISDAFSGGNRGSGGRL